ncbi:MAG TPA: RCC1 domain-containing protein [Propionicimonas sp.]|nr:RCC1 domain-containing protein [Propionicimonas sp.]
MGMAPAAAEAATPTAPKVSPKHPTRGAKFTASGRVKTAFRRTIILQTRIGGRWKKAAKAKTTQTGRYSFTTRTAATKPRDRVVVPKTRYHGHSYPRQVSKTRTFTTRARTTLRATQVAIGSEHTWALTSSGGVKCWGDNSYGVMGDGSLVAVRLSPTDVIGCSGRGLRCHRAPPAELDEAPPDALRQAQGTECQPCGRPVDGASG